MWIPTIIYHRVSDDVTGPARRLSVRPGVFEKQMRFLAEKGFRSVTPEEAALALEGRLRLPARPVVITFDDGYRDVYSGAFPVLRKYGLGATVFLVSDRIGGANDWDQVQLGWPPIPLLRREEIFEMASQGIRFGSHGRRHVRLTLLDDDALAEEVKGSKHELEGLLQREVSSFAYPYFVTDERVMRVVEEAGYAAACGADSLPNSPYYLNRLYLFHEARPIVRAKLFGWYHFLRLNRAMAWTRLRKASLARGTRALSLGSR